MKLLYCTKCRDVVAMHNHLRACLCGASSGVYVDDVNVTVKGPCIPLGFGNLSFSAALQYQPDSGAGTTFTAFVIPKEARSVKHEGP